MLNRQQSNRLHLYISGNTTRSIRIGIRLFNEEQYIYTSIYKRERGINILCDGPEHALPELNNQGAQRSHT